MKKVQTKVDSKVVVKQRIAVSIMMMAAFILTLSFAGMAIEKLNSRSLEKPLPIRPNPVLKAAPLVLNNISEAAVNISASTGYDGFNAKFYNDAVDLGRLNLGDNSWNASGDPWGVDPIERTPLRVELGHSSEGTETLPARIISLASAGTDRRYYLCVPESQIPGMDNYPNDSLSYFYDENGNPYYDAALTQKAFSGACAKLLSKALTVESVDQAAVNLRVPSEEGQFGSFQATFLDDYEVFSYELATLDLQDNSYWNHGADSDNYVSPLAVKFTHSNEGTLTMPSRLIAISNLSGEEKTLCVPESQVPGMGNYPNDSAMYFYDNQGNPYYDSLLTERALTKDCTDVLANALSIESVDEAAVNLRVPSEGQFGSFQATFLDDYEAYSYELGTLNLQDNSYWNHGMDSDAYISPLVVKFTHSNEGTLTMPSRLIAISNLSGEEKTLCVPESQVPGMDNYPNDSAMYFYDNNGTPYYDSLLTERALTKDCTDVLAQSLNITSLNRAAVNFPIRPEEGQFGGFQATFIDDYESYSDELATLYLQDNSYWNHGMDSDAYISPLVVKFTHGNEGTLTMPSRLIWIRETETDAPDYILCTPESQVPGMDNYPNDSAMYFYDNNGTPYYDSLLTERAIPRSCEEILSQALNINNIEQAVVDQLISDPEGAIAGFARNGGSLGALNLENNQYDSSYNGEPIADINDPLILLLGHNSDTSEYFPYRRITIRGEGDSYTLCVPPTQVPGMNNYPNDYAVYFYDSHGNPYSDNLLSRRVTCPPLKPINELPREEIPQ